MARFEFRLQSVLSLREKLQNQKELEYGHALQRLEEARAMLRHLQSLRQDNLDALSELIKTNIQPDKIERYNNYLDVLKERIILQERAVKAAEAYAEKKRQELVEAMRDKKSIERLRENQYEEYVDEEKRVEQRQVDQTVSYRYAKNME